MSFKCTINAIKYNVLYFKDFLAQGYVASGHEYEYTGEIHDDHWEMKCTNCGEYAGSEIGPDAKIEELK